MNFSAFVATPSSKKVKLGKKGIVIKIAGGKGPTVAVTSADLSGWTIAYGGGLYATPGTTANLGAGGNLTGSLTYSAPKYKSGTITLDWSTPISGPPVARSTRSPRTGRSWAPSRLRPSTASPAAGAHVRVAPAAPLSLPVRARAGPAETRRESLTKYVGIVGYG